MSMSQYLWAVARGLQTQVHPETPAGAARDTLTNSIHVLTVLANALESAAPAEVPRPAAAPAPAERADTDRLRGPAENTAAFGDTGAALAHASKVLDDSSSPAYLESSTREMIRWEKALIDAAVARMDAVVHAAPSAQHEAQLDIDPQKLQAFLRTRLSLDRLEVGEFRQVLGGRSRQTALFALRNAPGVPGHLVVQRLLPGLKTNAAFAPMATQYEVLERLHRAGLKVPKPFCFDADSEALGSPFLVTERSAGSQVQPDYWSPPKSKQVVLDLAVEMARLHSRPVEEFAHVVSRARPRSDLEGWQAELDRLSSDWHGLAHWPSVTVSTALAWLRNNIDCVEPRETLVHNDMVFHNILAEGDELTAILDWEQISIGHPAEDLGYCYPVVTSRVDWNEFLDAYYGAGGPRISARQIDYFALRAVLRLMILVLIGGRNGFEEGRGQDVLLASAGAYFSQRLLRRFAHVLEAVLERDAGRAAGA
jgi:aminoglycoside phosphotransferase (APT) family kinase protein